MPKEVELSLLKEVGNCKKAGRHLPPPEKNIGNTCPLVTVRVRYWGRCPLCDFRAGGLPGDKCPTFAAATATVDSVPSSAAIFTAAPPLIYRDALKRALRHSSLLDVRDSR